MKRRYINTPDLPTPHPHHVGGSLIKSPLQLVMDESPPPPPPPRLKHMEVHAYMYLGFR